MKKLFYLILAAMFPALSFANDMFAEPVHNLMRSLASYFWILAVAGSVVVCFCFFSRKFSKAQSLAFFVIIWLVFLWARH